MSAFKRFRKHARYNRKVGILYLFLVIIVGSMSIGYAFLSQTLTIDGITAFRNASWDIHFANVQPVAGSVEATTEPFITDDVQVEFAAALKNPGEFYSFTVDIVNAGSITAMVDSFSILPELTEAQQKYLTYKITYLDGSPLHTSQRLAGHTTETLKVTFEYLDGVSLVDYPSANQTLNVVFSIHYEQADESVESVRFSDDDWETIVNNVHNGTLPSCYRVGSTKTVDMGTLGIHTLRIANTSYPDECNQLGYSKTACGFVLEFTDSLASRTMASSHNGGGYPGSEAPYYLNSIVYNSLPDVLKNATLDTYIVAGHGSLHGSNYTSTEKLYLLSRREVFGYDGEDDSAAINTRQLDYYEDYGSRVKPFRGTNTGWWLRSIDIHSSDTFDAVTFEGNYQATAINTALGMAPAFRIG